MYIRISSNWKDCKSLKHLLEHEIEELRTPEESLVLEKESAVNRNVDPFLLWLCTTAGAAAISSIVERIISWWLEKEKGDKAVIILGKECIQIENASEFQKIEIDCREEQMEICLLKRD